VNLANDPPGRRPAEQYERLLGYEQESFVRFDA